MESIIINEKLVLPQLIKVKIFKGKSNVFIVELPEFDISTEVDSRFQVEEMLNDLVYVYFGVSEDERNSVRYVLKKSKEARKDLDASVLYVFQKFISSEAFRIYK